MVVFDIAIKLSSSENRHSNINSKLYFEFKDFVLHTITTGLKQDRLHVDKC